MKTDITTQIVLMDVFREREYQYNKWGDRSTLEVKDDFEKLPVLGEEFGEVNEHLAERANGVDYGDQALYSELIQTAAVAVSWAESIQKRNGGELDYRK